MRSISKFVALALVAGAVGVILPNSAHADLSGTYRIREGDETVTLQHVVSDPESGIDIYSLVCNGVFTSSHGKLAHNPATGAIMVKVTPVRNPLNLALQGEGTGSKDSGRTLIIHGLVLDRMQKTLHFD